MRLLPLSFCAFVLLGTLAFAAPTFPELTGRVVDDAHVLSDTTKASLEKSLADYEHDTTNQVVVATIPSLGGYSIDEYSNELGRHWQIGQKGKNNGVLLLVAPNDKKMRIEVGYGLEGVLTDAASSEIVHAVMIPAFRSGQIEKGIVDGAQTILDILGGKKVYTPPPARQPPAQTPLWLALLIVALLVWFFIYCIRHPLVGAYLIANRSSRFGGSGSSGWGSGGGFSGGGGSFGGGGASGGW